MVDVVHKRCKFDGCDTIVTSDSKYNGYCLFHFVNLFPDKPVARRFKVKEALVFEFLKEHFQGSFSYDKRIANGCSMKRPDVFIRCDSHDLVIEIDEHQHRPYACSCEEKRNMLVWMDANAGSPMKPIVFIRFNPDGYTDFNKKHHPSCFGVNKSTGTYGLMAKHATAWENRLNVLRETIERHLKNVPTQDFTEDYLYYDGFV